MKIPGPPPQTDSEWVDWVDWLIWAIETNADPDAVPPVVDEIDRPGPTKSDDWKRRKSELTSRFMSDQSRSTVGLAFEQLRRIVRESGQILEDPCDIADRPRRDNTVSRTLERCLRVLPPESLQRTDDIFAGRTDLERRVLHMAIAIEAGDKNWQSAGEPPAGRPRKFLKLEVDG